MAVSRCDQRKNYEEQEANAIGTEYVRAEPATAACPALVEPRSASTAGDYHVAGAGDHGLKRPERGMPDRWQYRSTRAGTDDEVAHGLAHGRKADGAQGYAIRRKPPELHDVVGGTERAGYGRDAEDHVQERQAIGAVAVHDEAQHRGAPHAHAQLLAKLAA